MWVPLSALICLSLVQLCVGDHPVEEMITSKKVPLLGAWNEWSVNDTEVQEATDFAVKGFNTGHRSKKLFKLNEIISAQGKVTNQIHFKIDAILVKTKCFKSENKDLKSCEVAKKHLMCHFKMTHDPRDNSHNIHKKKCKKHEQKV